MNKKAIYLISVFILLVSTAAGLFIQRSCWDNLAREQTKLHPRKLSLRIIQNSQNGNDQGETSNQEANHPAANQTECTKSFSASTNISEGQEFQAGDTIQVISP